LSHAYLETYDSGLPVRPNEEGTQLPARPAPQVHRRVMSCGRFWRFTWRGWVVEGRGGDPLKYFSKYEKNMFRMLDTIHIYTDPSYSLILLCYQIEKAKSFALWSPVGFFWLKEHVLSVIWCIT
jgi:hypothetical protein